MGTLAGKATNAGFISNGRQLSRSVVSAVEQLGEHADGTGVWRALAGSCASEGGGTVGGEVVGKLAPHAVTSSASAVSVIRCVLDASIAHGCDFVDAFTVVPFE